jgi:hypothetical protein
MILSVEQINNNTSTILYLHHDQQGSTRLITGSTGAGQCAEEWGLELPVDVYEVVEIEVSVHVVIEPAP